MSATRNSSMRALRQLSAHSHQVRQLHITGPATFPSRVLASEKSLRPSLQKDTQSPQSFGGIKHRSSHQDSSFGDSASRTMITAHAPVRPQLKNTSVPQKSTREINTSRTLKSPNDTSTVDFAYLPSEPATVPTYNMRVPIVPDSTTLRMNAEPVESPGYTMRSEVVTAAHASTHVSAPSTMHEVSDNTSLNVDYGALAEKMEEASSVVNEKTQEAQGTMRQLWNGMVDDIFGPKRTTA